MVWNVDCTIATVIDATLVVLAMAIGLVIGLGLRKYWQPWYRTLPKSRANPPDWVFSVVWPLLYLCIGAAGITARFYYEQPSNTTSYQVSVASQVMYYGQWALNIAWSPVFFLAHAPIAGFVILVLTLILSLTATILFFVIKWVPGVLMLPYVLWLCFAFYLNLRIVMKMRKDSSNAKVEPESGEQQALIASQLPAPRTGGAIKRMPTNKLIAI